MMNENKVVARVRADTTQKSNTSVQRSFPKILRPWYRRHRGQFHGTEVGVNLDVKWLCFCDLADFLRLKRGKIR